VGIKFIYSIINYKNMASDKEIAQANDSPDTSKDGESLVEEGIKNVKGEHDESPPIGDSVKKQELTADMAKRNIILSAQASIEKLNQAIYKWLKTGLVTVEDIATWPEILKEAEARLRGWTSSATLFKRELDLLLETGIVTKEQVASWESIRMGIKEGIITRHTDRPKSGYLVSNLAEWLEMGIVTKEQVASWPEIQIAIKKDLIKEAPNGRALAPNNSSFTMKLDNWVNLGLVTREQVAAWPELADLMKEIK
jgi:hypothetical protein